MTSHLRRFFTSRPISHAAKLGLTVAALWFVFHGIDFDQLSTMFARQAHRMLIEAAALLLCQMTLGAFRWRMILAALARDGQPVLRWAEALKIYYICAFFTCCLPGTVGGDVVRVWLTKSDRVPLPLAIHSVIIDRIIALAALVLLVLATLPLLGEAAGFNGPLLLPPLIAAAALGLWLLLHLDRLIGRFQHFRPVRWLLYFTGSLKLLLKHRRVSALSVAYAVLAHLCYCLAAYVLAQSLGIGLTVLQAITFLPLVLLLITLPVSIGGWGVREAGMVGLLALVGVPKALALMLSLQLGLLSVVISLPAGLLWLTCRRPGMPAGGLSLDMQP